MTKHHHRHGWFFLRKWLKEPTKIASPWPSSRYLARAMCKPLHHSRHGALVELGGGTGAVTHALLDLCADRHELYIIEKDEALAKMLASKYPEATIIRGDAGDMDHLLAERGVTRVSAVVSSLPMLLIPEQTQYRILQKSFEMLEKDGIFVQYTYGLRSPIATRILNRLGISGHAGQAIWRNLPPARVWSFRQAESFVASRDAHALP